MKGQVKNHSSHTLWVLISEGKNMNAYHLNPGCQSAKDVDADGFRAVDDILIDGYLGWIKIVDLCTATIKDKAGELTSECFFCGNVDDEVFGKVNFHDGDDWGEVIT